MNKKGIVLDVDESIMEKNLFVMPDSVDPLEKLIQPATSTMPFKIVKPSPGLCVKTHTIPDNKKVFVNICQTDAVPPPKDITTDELLDILGSMDADSYKIPMSIGEPKNDIDNKKQSVIVIDIAIHPSYFVKIIDDDIFKSFLFRVVFEALEFKHNITVNHEEFIILKNKKAFGQLQSHKIQDRDLAKMKGIEIPGDQNNEDTKKKQPMIEEVMDILPKTRTPQYRILREPDIGEPKKLLGEFLLTGVFSTKEFYLDIGEDRIVLEAPNSGFFLDIFIPYNINQDGVAAEFNKHSSILKVTMPVAIPEAA
ncbi:PIH1 domain-containing protein 1-like [Ctenocephalides felis]|uniref:PIH1 domain-containing protein 1-like n=1 Tax=Ctenocephalides felis TaxID=7515 RepID=UPI000E6E3A5A|nr:PIH1 domain-containing protein 1-like [Ctenocephalides felis]